MTISVFDLFKVGIGPSSSHKVGPMKPARMFARACARTALILRVATMRVALYGSLGLTGPGHGSDGSHFVSLDKAIATIRSTGHDMLDKYKETSRGGLAVTVTEC